MTYIKAQTLTVTSEDTRYLLPMTIVSKSQLEYEKNVHTLY